MSIVPKAKSIVGFMDWLGVSLSECFCADFFFFFFLSCFVLFVYFLNTEGHFWVSLFFTTIFPFLLKKKHLPLN